MKRYGLTKEQWERIKPLLPPEETGKRGRPRKDNRTMVNGMLWIVRSGARWRELPETYGPWQSVYARFAKWRDDGTLEAVFHALSDDADMEALSVSCLHRYFVALAHSLSFFKQGLVLIFQILYEYFLPYHYLI